MLAGVLALRGATAAPLVDPLAETDPRCHHSGQPAMYPRQTTPAAQRHNLSPQAGLLGEGVLAGATGWTQTGRANNSSSSSPEPRSLSQAPRLGITPAEHTSERQGCGQTRLWEVAQARLESGAASETSTAPRAAVIYSKLSFTQEAGLESQAALLANLNTNQSNNSLKVGKRRPLRRALQRSPVDPSLTGPAQRFLSGLKRSDPEEEEPIHFV